MAENVVIVGAKRTPIGAMQGKGVKPTEVDDVIFGCVLIEESA